MTNDPPIPPAGERRELLRTDMMDRARQGHHCAACTGVCCTFVANSMKITPLEALDLKEFLENENRWTPETFQALDHTIQRFRLDHDVGDGRRMIRKTYTCPFYRNGPQGCSISRKNKPYGCLAFNPRKAGLTEGGHCASAQDVLELREQAFPMEAAENERLRALWGWDQDKLPIPVALRRLPEDPAS